MGCVFCTDASIGKRTIAENKLVCAFLSDIPITPGHTLIMPQRHVAIIAEMTAEEKTAVFDLAEKIKSALVKAVGAQGFNMAWNEGEVAGQSVPHFHLHIVSRKPDDSGVTEYEPRKFLYRPGSRAESPQQELESVTALLRGTLSEI